MDYSFSNLILLDLFRDLTEWIQKSRSNCRKNGVKLPRLEDLRILHSYVSRLGVDSELIMAWYEKFHGIQIWEGRFEAADNYKQVASLVLSFFHQLLTVPKLQRYQVEAFLEFLGELSMWFDEVRRELRYFVTIFWDKPFKGSEDVQVQSLFSQFEGLLNRVGRLVHSFIFSPNSTLVEGVDDPINLLRANIIEFLTTQPSLVISKPIYRDLDSFFIIPSLLNDIEDLMNRCDNRIEEVRDEFELLHHRLMLAWSLLEANLENEEFKEVGLQIKDMSYRVEYVMNSFLVGNAPAWYLNITLSNAIHNIELTTTRLQRLETKYDIGASTVVSNYNAQLSLQGMSDFEVHENIFIGFEEEEESILDQVTGPTQNLQFISIFGMPGLGKTTLAKKLYNHPLILHHFDRRSWCVVSQRYHRKRLLIDILNNMGEKVNEDKDEGAVALQVHQTLVGRRYLIILDDIWNSSVWDDLQNCFPNDGNGSRILFTSRNKDVAPPGTISNKLPFFTNEQCCKLLAKKVFNSETYPPQLEGVGKEIAANCKGLPLVVVVIAGLLSALDKDIGTWEIVAQNIHSYLIYDENKFVMQVLELSYKQLPQYLKPCFLYFGMFPEDEEIYVKRLVQLWIAEGFIDKEKEKSIAEEYLMELVNKGLVMVGREGSDGRAKTCVMHDLIREMCLQIAEEENFLKYIDSDEQTCEVESNRIVLRPSSTHLQPYLPRIRSIFCSTAPRRLSVKNMKLLRVLNCWGKDRRQLRSWHLVGTKHLVNLRYLATGQVPKSIRSFVNLEYLIVNHQDIYKSLLVKMVKLRYLKADAVRGTVFLDQRGCHTSQTNNLEFLSKFVISNPETEGLLRNSPQLHRLKCTYLIQKGNTFANLSFLTQLESLSVIFLFERGIFEVEFPLNIKKLTLEQSVLSWEKVSIIGALPNLEVLKLQSKAFVGERWDARDGEFKKLKFLKLENLGFKQWNVPSIQCFPRLQQLVLIWCWALEEIPCEIGDISTLQLIHVKGCEESVKESAKQILEEQHELGNDGLKVTLF